MNTPGPTRPRSWPGAHQLKTTIDRYGQLFPGRDERLRDGLEATFQSVRSGGAIKDGRRLG